MPEVKTEWDHRVALANNWAHDYLTSEQYENDEILDLTTQAYMAGYDRGIDV